MVTAQPLGAHPSDAWWPWDHRVFIKTGNKTRGHTNTVRHWHHTPVCWRQEIFIMVITSTGGRPQLSFYLSIVIQIGENIPTNQGQLKNFRPIIKSLTSGDWSVIRILRDLRSGVGWRLGWVTCSVTWWPRTGRAGGTLTNERNVNVIPAQPADCFPRYEQRERERESGADGKMLLLYLLLAPITEPSRPLHNGKLSGGNLKLAPISLSLARDPISGAGLAAQVEPTFTRRAASPAAHPPGAFPPFHSQHQLFLSTFPFNVRPVLTTPDYFQQEIYSV